jgi:hypothetical protein
MAKINIMTPLLRAPNPTPARDENLTNVPLSFPERPIIT